MKTPRLFWMYFSFSLILVSSIFAADIRSNDDDAVDSGFVAPRSPIPSELAREAVQPEESRLIDDGLSVSAPASSSVPQPQLKGDESPHPNDVLDATAPADSDGLRETSPKTGESELLGALAQRAETPDREGVITLGDNESIRASSPANPFDFRVKSLDAPKEIKIRVGGLLGGKRPAALLNGRVVTRGDRFEGFNVAVVSRDGVVLEKNGVFVRLPAGRTIQIREASAR